MNKEDIEYYTFQYTIPIYKIKPPQDFCEYYQIHKDEIIVELDKENELLKKKLNQLETNRDEAIAILEYYLIGNMKYEDSQEQFKRLKTTLERGKE